MISDEYHIFGGRWQPPHRGHIGIIQQLFEKYNSLVINIVNFDPSNPPDPDFDKFFTTGNILGYWDRYYLIMHILIKEGFWKNSRINPSWHPRKRMSGENYFFPPKNKRIWIFPLSADEEERKIADYNKIGENFEIIRNISTKQLSYSGTKIRHMILQNDPNWVNLIYPDLVPILEKINYEEKTKSAYNSSVFEINKSLKSNISTVIIVGKVDTFNYKYINLIKDLLRSNDTVTICPVCIIDSKSSTEWPEFSLEEQVTILNFWERMELIRLVENENPDLIGRLIIHPFLVYNNSVGFNYKLLPSFRHWIIADKELTWLANQLTTEGEDITLNQLDTDILVAAESMDINFNQQQKEYLKKLNINYRIKKQSMEKEKKSGGMNFYGSVTIQGNAVNIEGNQYNLATDDKSEIYNALLAILKSDSSNEVIIKVINELQQNSVKLNIGEVEQLVAKELKEDIKQPERKNKFKQLLSDLGSIVSTGNIIIKGVIEGLKLLGIG